jgi:hypothetical protein
MLMGTVMVKRRADETITLIDVMVLSSRESLVKVKPSDDIFYF